MFSTQINKILERVPHFIGCFPRDKLPEIIRRPASLIVNTDPSTEPGEHWVAIHIDESAEYFDSYGLPPHHKEIIDYLEDNSLDGKIAMNHVTLQTPGFSVTCGHYATLFVVFKSEGHTFEEMLNLFTRNTFLNDIIVKRVLSLSPASENGSRA